MQLAPSSWPSHELREQALLACAGGATRSYLYVEDVAEAFDCVLHKVCLLPGSLQTLIVAHGILPTEMPCPKPTMHAECMCLSC